MAFSDRGHHDHLSQKLNILSLLTKDFGVTIQIKPRLRPFVTVTNTFHLFTKRDL